MILHVAKPGEVLGIVAAFSGSPYELTAETIYCCKIASVRRQSFLDFLLRHPAAYRGVARELSLDYTQACERLRTIGFSYTASGKLAQLVLEWCASGHQTRHGISFTIPLTHEEIGDCIGHSRETVSRTLVDLKHRNLVDIHGSTLIVQSSVALQRHAYKSQKRKVSSDTADPSESEWPAA